MITYSTEEAAKILGVNVSTIKRWSASGKLNCIKTAGGHRKFEMQHLTEFVEKHRQANATISTIPIENEEDLQLSEWILKKKYDVLYKFTLKQALNNNRQRVLQILKGLYLAKIGLHEIYDGIVTPVLHEIGDLWEAKQISIIEEHFASQTMKDSIIRLQSLIARPEIRKGVAMCMNLQNEMHDIPLKLVDHILEYRGYKVLYSGQITPQIYLQNIIEDFGPKRIYISGTYVKEIDQTQKELDLICDIAEKNSVDVFVGGQAFNLLNYEKPAVIDRLYTFQDVYEK
ncbi:MAG: helix-turn-helix domain-containing protein [Calditrichaeota bacterium]|nr:helix-turn-helix domain-containing protein [Calditrichota bacterium]